MARTSFAVLAVCVLAGSAAAQVTTQGGGSVLVFPRVVADGTWDTTIEIANSANHLVHARCFYIDGQPTVSGQPVGPTNPPLWTQTDFEIWLTRLQPTQWTASRGRANDASDPPCRASNPPVDCGGAGFDPGSVPSTSPGFTGELRCIELDASGAPWSGNSLEGVATLTDLRSGAVVKYSAIGVPGFDTNDADGTLCMGTGAGDGCPGGAEYGACPDEWYVSHPTDVDDSAVDGPIVSTTLTVVPCAVNFLTQVPETATLQFQITNEMEQKFSAATTITCWSSTKLSDVNPLLRRDLLGTDWALTRLHSAVAQAGFLVVEQTQRETGWPPTFAAAAIVPPHSGTTSKSDRIELPEETAVVR